MRVVTSLYYTLMLHCLIFFRHVFLCLKFSGMPEKIRHGLDVPEKIRHCLKKSGRATYNRKKCVQGQLTRYQNTIEAILLRNGCGIKRSSLMYEFLQEQVTKDIHSSRFAPD